MSRTPSTLIIEGLDRLGKSTLIENIQRYRGAHVVVHSGKPPSFDRFNHEIDHRDQENEFTTQTNRMQANYQNEYFLNAFKTIKSNKSNKVIYDRLHLGEVVYSPLYRNIIANSVMRNEAAILGGSTSASSHVRLILLTEDFSVSKHFESDGDSFDDSKREVEQTAFISAFNKSVIYDKRIICVTAADGGFKHPLDILAQALA